MKNFIVLHQVNNKIIARWDFGEELDTAINFIHDAMEECYQNGKHVFVVALEGTTTIYYKQEFEMEGVTV